MEQLHNEKQVQGEKIKAETEASEKLRNQTMRLNKEVKELKASHIIQVKELRDEIAKLK